MESRESKPDPEHVRVVFEFMMFLGDTLSQSLQRFEDTTTCSPAAVEVLPACSQSATH